MGPNKFQLIRGLMNGMFNLASLTKAKLEITSEEFEVILTHVSMSLPMKRRITSPTPMGRTPGHLLNGINLKLLCASKTHAHLVCRNQNKQL